MAALKKISRSRLKGSTLIETMVASVIFLCVFIISLETVSRLTVTDNDSTVLIEVDHRMAQCRREFSTGEYEAGKYVREYRWGTVNVELKPYRDYETLCELTVTAEIKRNPKRLEYRYVFERNNNSQEYAR